VAVGSAWMSDGSNGEMGSTVADEPTVLPGDATPVGIRRPSEYLPRLEAMRGIAIALVVVYHADQAIRPQSFEHVRPGLLEAFLEAGHTGVSLFFVLSAFLLSRPFLRALAGRGTVSLSHFFERRALRVLPLYWVAVAVSSVLFGLSRDTSWLNGLPYLLFINSFFGVAQVMSPFSDVWWSLATEAQFYLALPVAASLARWRAGRWFLGALLVAFCVSYAQMAARGFYIFSSNAYTSLYGRLPVFVFGIAAAWTYDRHGERIRGFFERRSVWQKGGADLLLVAVLLALGLLLQQVAYLGYFVAEASWHAWHVVEGLLWALVVLLVLSAPLRIAPLFDSRALMRVGVLSYSLYLVHLPIIHYLREGLRGRFPEIHQGWNPVSFLFVGLCIATALGLSSVTYRFVERPFLVRKARIAQ